MKTKKELRKELQQTIYDIKLTIQFEGENYRCKYSGQTMAQQLKYYTIRLENLNKYEEMNTNKK